jgi:hypothetical protein
VLAHASADHQRESNLWTRHVHQRRERQLHKQLLCPNRWSAGLSAAITFGAAADTDADSTTLTVAAATAAHFATAASEPTLASHGSTHATRVR